MGIHVIMLLVAEINLLDFQSMEKNDSQCVILALIVYVDLFFPVSVS